MFLPFGNQQNCNFLAEILVRNFEQFETKILPSLSSRFRGYEVRIAVSHPVGWGSNPHKGVNFFSSSISFLINILVPK